MKVPTLDLLALPLEGTTLVEASAGTGKTHTIATLFVRLLLEKRHDVSEILVVTYTRAATAELRLRIRRRVVEALAAFTPPLTAADPALRGLAERALESGTLDTGRARLAEALRRFDEAAISTIHGYCQRVLGTFSFESGSAFGQQLLEDDRLLVREVVQDFWATRLSASSLAFAAHLRVRRVTIDNLAQLVERALSNPDIALLPPLPDPGRAPARGMGELEQAVLQAATRVEQLWRDHTPALITCLLDGRLYATTYKNEVVRRQWHTVLVSLTQRTAAELPDWLRHLTPDGLRSKTKKGKAPPTHPFFDACSALQSASDALRELLDAELVSFRHALLEYARTELAKRKAETAEVGFEDLLLQLRAALRSERSGSLTARLRATHPAALIDEFQDTDPVQTEIFQRIYENGPATLLLVGDPKQAIYAFRGADIFAYLEAARSAKRVSLPVNYRSDPKLLAALNAVWSPLERPFLWEEIAYLPVAAPEGAADRVRGPLAERAPFEILFVPRNAIDPENTKPISKAKLEYRLPELVALEIVRVLESGSSLAHGERAEPIAPRHIAVLCRTNRQAQQVQAELRKARVPSVLDGDASVFDSDMASELARVMTAMAEPTNPGGVRAALATSILGVGGHELQGLEQDERRWDDYLALFHELCELWQTRGFIRAAHALLDRCDVAKRLLVRDDGERRYTDLMHLIELLHGEALRNRTGPLALLEWHRRMMQGERERSGLAAADVQIRLESDAHAVTLTTIHKSKGLEYPLVYCPFSWDGGLLRGLDKEHPRFHDDDHDRRLTLELGSDGAGPADRHLERARAEALSEELRLLYVALTRAKHRVTVVWGSFATADTSALGYVLHQASGALTDGDLPALTSKSIKEASDAELRAKLGTLAEASGGAIEVRAVELQPPRPWARAGAAVVPLASRVLLRSPVETQRSSSFSRLAAQPQLSAPASEGIDRDEAAPLETSEHAPADRARVPLADFEAGASFGHLVHAIYEHSDFRAAEANDLLPTVQAQLLEYGMTATPAEPLAAALFDTLRTPLATRGLALPSLSVIGPDAKVAELEFVFPLPEASAPAASKQQDLFAHTGVKHDFNAKRLAALFASKGESATERAYADRLRTLDFGGVSGFVRGFMDLVVEHAGRYYLVDYKSNHLGEHVDDYAFERLSHVMISHHYVLQATIYSVALHRYLQRRLPGYAYERNFGGVYYLFIRGMNPAHPLGAGVFAERPSPRLIAAFDGLLGQGGAA